METIAAISTPYGKGGVAVIRVSGDDAVAVSERVFFPANGIRLGACRARTQVFGKIRFGEEEIDTGLACVFAAPGSFTGEDTVEISCHGGVLVTQAVLTAVLAAGARQALPGEFTRRAFLNGKMGLSAAEALGALLDAKTNEQMRLGGAGVRGILAGKTEELYCRMKTVLASVFARIDYPDEDLADLSREEIRARIHAVREDLDALAATYRTGHAIAEGIPTVLVGATNAGKSSLYNRLTGRDAAIVTEIAGTTRDVLTETVSLGRVTLRISDTAGIRDTDNMDAVERIGVHRALDALEEAELILLVVDGSQPVSEDLSDLLRRLSRGSAPVIALLNKADLALSHAPDLAPLVPERVLPVSAVTGEGMETLVSAVEALFLDGKLDPSNDAILSTARQNAAVLRAGAAAARAVSAIDEGLPLDLSLSDIEDAMSALSELDGRQVGEDIVAEIFSKFCVGK